MKLIYVAGKYLGDSDWETYLNIHHARVVAHKLWHEGWAVICPHSNTAYFGGIGERNKDDPNGDWKRWLEGDLEMVRRCDAIYMLSNWRDSKGAKLELEEARKVGKKIFYETKPPPEKKAKEEKWRPMSIGDIGGTGGPFG